MKKRPYGRYFNFNHIGNCAQNVRIFAYEIKVYLFVPQEWGTEGVEVLKHFFILIVFCVNFEVCLRMVTGGANLGGFNAHNDVTAVTAFPNLYLALFEHFSCFNVL